MNLTENIKQSKALRVLIFISKGLLLNSRSLALLVLICFTPELVVSQWEKKASGTTNQLTSIYFTDQNTGYVCGAAGTILKTTNAGETWIAQTTGTTLDLKGIHFPTPNVGYAVGSDSAILKTSNGGANWQLLTNFSHRNFSCVNFVNADTGYVGRELGQGLIRTSDGGQTWQVRTTNLPYRTTAIHFPTVDTGYLVGLAGTNIHRTNNGFNTWFQIGQTNYDLWDVHFPNVSIGYAVGSAGLIVKTINGNTWTTQNSGTSNYLKSTHFLNNLLGYAVGHNGTILKTIDGGSNWYPQISGLTFDHLRSIFVLSSCTALMVGDNGTILKTTNGGTKSNFTSSDTVVCQGSTIVFTNTGSGLNTYKWTIDGVQFSTAVNTERLFNQPGTYSIGLISSAAICDADTTFQTITVLPKNISAGFTVSDSVVYLENPATVNFTNSSVGFVWNWNFGDGSFSSTQNPSHTYAIKGTDTVILVVYDGECTDTSTKVIRVLSLADLGFTELLNGLPIGIYPNPSSGEFTIDYGSINKKQFELSLINMQGQVIFTRQIEPSEKTSEKINLSGIPNGLYGLQFKDDDNNRFIKKIIIQ